MTNSARKAIELGALIAVYALFAAIGVYGGQTTMDVHMIRPPDGMESHSSPVELVARVAIRGTPVSDVRATFTVRSQTGGESNINVFTDADGMARLLVPASSGNYTWRVAAMKEDYPTIVSLPRSFSIRLSLVVDALLPSRRIVAVSPVDFKARVTDEHGRLVESANVTFYVDSIVVGTTLSGQKGIAALSSPVTSGSHTWYASATKEGDGGVSNMVPFIVGKLGSLTAGKSPLLVLLPPQKIGAVRLLQSELQVPQHKCSRAVWQSELSGRNHDEEFQCSQRVAEM